MNQEDIIQESKQETKQEHSMKMFLVLIAGQFISGIGSGLTDFGLAIYVLHLTGSVTATAIVSICAFLPSILLTPLGGILADRYDRRKMMMLGELFSGLGLIVCLISILSGSPSLYMICVGVALSSVFTALMEPAFKATVTDMISEEDFAKAGGLIQIANSAKLLISPALAGLLLKVTPVSTLLIIDILTFLTTVLTIAFVRKNMTVFQKEHTSKNFITEMKEGVEAIRGTDGVWALILIMTAAVFCLGFIQILSKPMILAYADETELGTLSTVVAVGMLVGSIVISCIKHIRSYSRMLAAGLIGCGLFMALMGARESIILTACFGFLMFICMPVVQISAETMIRKNLANEVQGRAFGLIGFVSQMGYIVAYACSGVLADYIFEPFMKGSSKIAAYIGTVIGTGTGRGIALLVMLAGIALILVGLMVLDSKKIKKLSESTKIEFGQEVENEVILESCM